MTSFPDVRAGDVGIGAGSHSRRCCPHPIITTSQNTSPNTRVDSLGQTRLGDVGNHLCPHCGISTAILSSKLVRSDGKGHFTLYDFWNTTCGFTVAMSGSPITKSSKG